MRQFFASVIEVAQVAFVAVVAVVLIRNFLVQPFLVSGLSMVPNFHDGDYLLVDELTYRFREPQRGEVAVFRYPNDESTYFIKRIIGLPGERVVVQDGQVRITTANNSEEILLEESYLPPELATSGDLDIKLEPEQYFVLGDNRSYSFDSRRWGPLSAKEIIGLVRLRLWPISTAQAFVAPYYY